MSFHNITIRRAIALALTPVVLPCALHAAGFEWGVKDRQPTPAELATMPVVVPEKVAALLKEVKAPAGFEVTLFATPPAVNYPVFVSAAADGTLYVSSDGNGSIDRKPHLGRVLRVRDTNGDGQGDEVKAFVADVDSPRGLVWDQDRLYLLHPPDISVFFDRDHDGVAEERQTLVSGIGWTFKDRPADHASNGLELGVDGWLYAAIGDFGFMEAKGTDGKTLQMRGGGVIRVRPDGTGLEVWADGTRNILEAATSPLLDLFARDNTNDGGGWDIRLHHFSGMTQHGYPRLFKNFPDEIIQPLADYGGGSGCGAAWVDEPGIPAAWNNAPFTADWGRDMIYHHGLTPKGATYTATQEEFLKLPRPTDLDVDGNSAIYAASWKGATFTWTGPEVGFIARITPKGFQASPVPRFGDLSPSELVKTLESSSHSRRMAAQRVLIRQTLDTTTLQSIEQLAADRTKPTASRIAALFLLKQNRGSQSHPFLNQLVADPSIAPWAIRALADRIDQTEGVDQAPLKAALSSADPRTRKEGAIALARIGKGTPSSSLLPLLTDADPIVAQTAVQAMIHLKEWRPLLDAYRDTSATENQRVAALRVLQHFHEPESITELLRELETTTNPNLRRGLLTTLCRLHFVEGKWKGDSWGTRPDTRGPFYQPEPWSETPRISTALMTVLKNSESSEVAYLGRELARHRIPAGAAMDSLIERAAKDASLIPAIASQLSQAEETPASGIPLMITALKSRETGEATRAQAVMALTRTADAEAWRAVLQALPLLAQAKSENNLVEKAQASVRNAAHLDQVHSVFEEMAAKTDGAVSQTADELLLKLASRKVGAPEAREAARGALDAGWNSGPARKTQILRAAARAGDSSRAAQFVAALQDKDESVAAAARETVKRLKIDPAQYAALASQKKVGEMAPAMAAAMAETTHGDITRGEQLFNQVGCNACHTVKKDEPLKGPFLGTIANVYRRRDLAEAILMPSKSIAQGFVANKFEMKDGAEWDGFVVREAADAVTIRTIAAQELTLAVKDIVKREKQERSLMPEGLAAGLTVTELASLLDYIESLAKGNK